MSVTLVWWSLSVLVIVIGFIGLMWFLLNAKMYKTLGAVVVLGFVIVLFNPFRLTVDNTATIQADNATFERHQELPEKVAVKPSSFSEVLAKSAETNRRQNEAVKRENLGEQSR